MTASRTPIALLLAAALWGSAALVLAAPRAGPEAKDIDAFTRKAMARIGVVPGLTLAVVEGDKGVITAGYGVASADTAVPVDADTRFYIASATKSFSGLAIAGMAARRDIALDAPLADWIGSTPLPADIARSVSLTDLLSHRSGVENAPIAFRAALSGDQTPRVMQALLSRTVKSATTSHGTFRYTNTGYKLATTLIEARFGRDWRALVTDGVLKPAGMAHTTAWISQARKDGVIASGHVAGPTGAMAPSRLQKTDTTMQSAGGVRTLHPRWLRLRLADRALRR